MLRIDCLLKNTEVADTVRKIIGFLGHKGIADGKDVSFREMYKTLRKSGVEVDLETAAHIYANELDLNDSRFTSQEDLKFDTGRWFDNIVRAITLQKPKKGEVEIGELSPSQAVVKGYADAFANNVSGDESTKSILKTLEDLYRNAGKRMLGELPNAKEGAEPKSTAEIIKESLENEAKGFRNVADGTMNGLAKMHEDVRKQIAELTQHMQATGDIDKIEQWNNYAKSLEDASYTMLFSSKEAKQVLHDSLKEQGFLKTTKEGKELLDWEKLSGNVNSYEQLRENVINSLTKNGFSEDIANRVADSLHKEFRDVRAKMIEVATKKQERIADTWSEPEDKQKKTLGEIVDERVKEWNNYTQFEGKENEPLNFTKTEAKNIIGDTLKNSDKYGMDFGADKRAINWLGMAQDPPSLQKLYDMVKDHLKSYDGTINATQEKNAELAAESVVRDYHNELTNAISENSKRLLDTKQAALDAEPFTKKSDLARLGELHDLGIFDGAHDRLLSHVLGIDPADVEAIRSIKIYAEKLSKLRQLLGGNDFIVPSVVHTLNREIHSILAPVIGNKTTAMKYVSAINKIFQVENSLLIATHGNMLENVLSGSMEILTSNLNMRLKLGSELGGVKDQDVKLWKDIIGHISAGGAENGLAPHQVGGAKERPSDKYTIHKMMGADWSKPATWAKGVATAVMTIPRTGLSAMDGANKTMLMNAHMKGGVVDALVASSGGKMTKDQAVQLYNDAIYGEGQLEKAKQTAKDIYKNIGLKYVSEKELNITANEILRENLIGEGKLDAKTLEEVMKNAYHQAGLGMGHESNNFVSKRQQSAKTSMNQEESKAIADHDWDKAASLRLKNTILNDVIFRFAASRFNWATIRLEQAGAGIIRGMWHMSATNRKYKNEDLLDPKKMNEAAVEYQKARQQIARGLVGLSLSAFAYGTTKAIANAMNKDEEDPTEAMFDQLKDNYQAKALFLKVAPLWLLQSYEYNQTKKGDALSKATHAGLMDFVNLTSVGDKHDISVQVGKAATDIGGNSEKQVKKGYAELGAVFNNFVPHVPLYRQGKNIATFANWIGSNEPSPMPPYPVGFWQGLLGGGVIQDAVGHVRQENLPEELKPWGKE